MTATPPAAPARPAGTLANLGRAFSSWRTASVSLLSFSSGLPLGLVWIAIPDWLRSQGVDIKTVGLITLAQAPWTFKLLWSPLMDRFVPPFLGRRRGWIALAQLALFVTTLALAGVGQHPDAPWVVGAIALAIAFAAASQDIAYDAYSVDVLRPDEQGPAVGAKTAIYRGAMFLAGGAAISFAKFLGWPLIFVGMAMLYLPLLLVTLKAPEPEERVIPPKSLEAALWEPLVGFLARPRALEILAFVLLYKLADQLGQALLRPFLVDLGYNELDRGVALATVSLVATLVGTFLGGSLTTVLGLGRALWIFGCLQIFSNLGYILLNDAGVNRPLLWAALGFESLTQGLGTGAFGVLLLRLTERRFSATQFALFSSLFGLPRVVSGPLAGLLVDAMGWKTFFWLTMAMGIPGLVLLSRFVPWRVQDPRFEVEPVTDETAHRALPRATLVERGLVGGVLGLVFAGGLSVVIAAVKTMRASEPHVFDLMAATSKLLHPAAVADWLEPLGIVVCGVFCGLFAAAIAAARGSRKAPPTVAIG